MGEVYRARDARLKRDVAVKVLPSAFAASGERLRRFEQEAQAASALNHPNILAIYDLGTHEGAPYIVSELLEGETLRGCLSGEGFTARRAIGHALQIAQGLAAAHEKGIVHRDLKPENIFVTNDGRVKILDFGLARVTEPENANASATNLPTVTPGTEPGVVLGTIGYMSPEQVRGKVADERSDIFSFGAILYEMLSGRRAFHGESAADAMSAILTKEPPDLSETDRRIPESLDRIVRHCLEKSPEARFHSASDVAFDLEAISGMSGEAAVAAAPHRRLRASIPAALAVLVALGLGFLWGGRMRNRAPTLDPIRSVLLLSEGVTLRCMAISPDGRRLAISGLDAEGKRRLWTRSLDSFDFQALAGTEGGELPFWSPDGRWIGFFASGKLRKIDASGGPAVVLADSTGVSATWGRNGDILFGEATGGLFRVSASGGKATAVTKPNEARHETSHRYPQFLPDGRHFLYFAANLAGSPEDEANQIHVASLDSKEDRAVMRGYSRTLYAQGNLLYLRAATFSGPLMAQPFDPLRLEIHGEPMTVADKVSVFGDYYLFGNFTASENGALVYDSEQLMSRMLWFDRAGRQVGEFGVPAILDSPRISPDGGRVAYSSLDSSMNKMQIWVGDLSRGVRTRLTNGPSENTNPAWSPDGNRIAFRTDRKHQGDIYVKASGGGSEEEPLYEAAGLSYPEDWSLDGRYLIHFHYSSGVSGARLPAIRAIPFSGDRRAFDFVRGGPDSTLLGGSRFSPDGQWVAHVADESGRAEVYVASFPGHERSVQVSDAGGVLPTWRRDGREIFYVTPDGMLMAVGITPGPKLSAGVPKPLFRMRPPNTIGTFAPYDVAPDGQRFLVIVPVVHGSSVPLNFVLNWTSGLKKEK
jgi:eukaryotic-like serine/threonine-protein kinase